LASKAVTEQSKSARVTPATKVPWPLVRFGDVVLDVKATVDRDTTKLTRFVAGEHMDSDDVHLRRWGELNGDYLGPAFHRGFRKGQVLYGSRRTYLRKVAVAPFDGICANTTFVLESSDKETLLPELLPFIMLTDAFTQHSIRESKGSVNPYINWKDIAKYQFPLPPKDEQRRIADILWSADESIEKWRDAFDVATGLKQNILEKTFSASEFPKRIFGEFVLRSAYGPRFSNELYSVNGEVGQIRTTDMDDCGKINYQSVPKTSLSPAEYESHLLEHGDFLISRSGTCGIGSVFEKQSHPMVAGAFLIRFCLKKELNPWFLKEYINSPVGRRQMSKLSQGGVQQNIRGSSLLNERFPIPSINEQEKVIERLNALSLGQASLLEHTRKVSLLKKELIAVFLEGKHVH
jgi:type I restriction enzyme S subunit